MRYDANIIMQVRRQTNASLRDCLAMLAAVYGDPDHAVSAIHRLHAQALAEQTGVAFADCLRVIQQSDGDIVHARRMLGNNGQLRLDRPSSTPESISLIYVAVDGYSVPVWQPVEAEHLHDHCYRIRSKNPDPEHDDWQFQAGDVVHCTWHDFADHEGGFVAREPCTHRDALLS